MKSASKLLQHGLLSVVILSASTLHLSCSTSPLRGSAIPPESAQTLAHLRNATQSSHLTLAIVGTNDIHGTLSPIPSKTSVDPGTGEAISYERAGLATLASHLRILKKEFGERLLWLDGGDQFQGSIESNLNEGAPMVEFFNRLGLTASALGNHEFDFGPEGPEGTPGDLRGALKKRMAESKYPYLASNLRLKPQTKNSAGAMPDLPNLKKSILIPVGPIQVGILGLSTQDTPVTTRPEFVRDLEFTDPVKAALAEATALRKAGATLVIGVAHLGSSCQLGNARKEHCIRKESDPLGHCRSEDEGSQLLEKLPKGTLDLLISGHTHQVVHHWINGTPMLQAGSRGSYLNVAYLTVDLKTRTLMRDQTLIEGPIMNCPKVFSNLGHCDGDAPLPKVLAQEGRGSLVTPVFHDEKVLPDPEIHSFVENLTKQTGPLKDRKISYAARRLEHPRFAESPLGNLVADALRKFTQADVALMNSGGIRAPIESGTIRYEDLFRTLPFDNSAVILRVTGKELVEILRIAESGARGVFPVSGVQLKLRPFEDEAHARDLNGNGKADPWEADRLWEVRTLPSGKMIQPDREYRLVTLDFLASGGDDLGWIMDQIPSNRRETVAGGLVREVVEKHLASIPFELASKSPEKGWNSADFPLVDPTHPRVIFEKRSKKSSRRKARKK